MIKNQNEKFLVIPFSEIVQRIFKKSDYGLKIFASQKIYLYLVSRTSAFFAISNTIQQFEGKQDLCETKTSEFYSNYEFNNSWIV